MARSQRRAPATAELPTAAVQPSTAAESDPTNGRATIAHLADEVLPLLIARLGASGLGELEVRQDGWRVRLRRAGPGQAEAPSSSMPAGAATRATSIPRSHERREPAANPDGAAARDTVARRERGRVAITSPGVGYYQPVDGLAAGQSVRSGDLLGHVDVLGVRQAVVVPESGILAALAAEAGEAVEYGQLLARIEPEERG